MKLDDRIRSLLRDAGYEHNQVRFTSDSSEQMMQPGEPGWRGRVIIEFPIFDILVKLYARIAVPRRKRSLPEVTMSMSPYATQIINKVHSILIQAMEDQRDGRQTQTEN